MYICISFYALYSCRCRVESKFPCGGRGLWYASLISCSDFFFPDLDPRLTHQFALQTNLISWSQETHNCSDFFFPDLDPHLTSPIGSLFKLIWCLDHKRRTTALISFFPDLDPRLTHQFALQTNLISWSQETHNCSDFFFPDLDPHLTSPIGSLFKLIWCLDHKRRTTALISFFPVFDLYATPHSSNLFDILIEMPNWHTRYARLCNGYSSNRCTQNIPKICPLPNICPIYVRDKH